MPQRQQPPRNIRWAILIFVLGAIIASCSEKSSPDRDKDADNAQRETEAQREGEEERQPDEDRILEDCVAFVRATKIVTAGVKNAECPGCPVAGTDALMFQQVKTDALSCADDTCCATVTIRAVFKPGAGERLAGGLTAWIPPEQRTACLNGQTPTDVQAYRVRITYKRRGGRWQAIEFDR